MKIAIMQPYIFPYIGYFMMIKASDIFVFYDNVQYINRGFVNRNKILINGEGKYFNFQIEKDYQFNYIKEVPLKNFKKSKEKFLNQLFFSYKRAPYFEEIFNFIKKILSEDFQLINELNIKTTEAIAEGLGIETIFDNTSNSVIENFKSLNKEEKLNALILKYNATRIILPSGSIELYDHWTPPGTCQKQTLPHIDLKYRQFSNSFVPNLSIIDVLMFNSFKGVSKFL